MSKKEWQKLNKKKVYNSNYKYIRPIQQLQIYSTYTALLVQFYLNQFYQMGTQK